MTHFLLIVLIITILISCKQRKRSDIEVIKYDTEMVDKIRSNYYSTYTDSPQREDFWTVEHYLIDTTKEALIFNDSLSNVVAIVKKENDKTVFAGEYYPNGQLKGKVEYSLEGVLGGPAKYYYEDGRVRSKGQWEDFKRVGKWENYNEDGYLESIVQYDETGDIVSEEKME